MKCSKNSTANNMFFISSHKLRIMVCHLHIAQLWDNEKKDDVYYFRASSGDYLGCQLEIFKKNYQQNEQMFRRVLALWGSWVSISASFIVVIQNDRSGFSHALPIPTIVYQTIATPFTALYLPQRKQRNIIVFSEHFKAIRFSFLQTSYNTVPADMFQGTNKELLQAKWKWRGQKSNTDVQFKFLSVLQKFCDCQMKSLSLVLQTILLYLILFGYISIASHRVPAFC